MLLRRAPQISAMFLLAFLSFTETQGAAFTSAATGNWNVANTWGLGGSCGDSPGACSHPAGTHYPGGIDNVTISATHTVTLVFHTSMANATLNATSAVVGGGFFFRFSGNLVLNGSITGCAWLISTGAGAIISGTGSVQGTTSVRMLGGAKTILAGSVLSFNFPTFNLEHVLATVTNNGSVTLVDGTNLNATVAGPGWVNTASSTLKLGGTVFVTNGTLTASAADNTVEYHASVAQTLFNAVGSNYWNLVLSNGGVKTVPANLNMAGSVEIRGAAQLNSNGFDLTVGANWSNTSVNADPFVQGTRLVTFNGSIAQTITHSSNETFHNIVINNTSAAGITLGSKVTVSGALTLTDGYVASTAANILELLDNATSTGGSAASFVDGPMRKVGNDAFVFPVGDGAKWARIAISAPGVVTDAFEAEYFPVAYVNTTSMEVALNNVSTEEYWILNRTVGTSNVNVTLYWEDGTFSGITNLPDLLVARFNSGDSEWKSHGNGGTTGAPAAGSVTTSAAVTTFSPFTFGSSAGINPLPVELLYFNVEEQESSALLLWATASELNSDYFAIERSQDGRRFEKIGNVSSSGNSTRTVNYTFIDETPLLGTSYYRLRQVDLDGVFEFAPVAATFIRTKTGQIAVYPNPAKNMAEITVDVSGFEIAPGLITAQLTGMDGRVLYRGRLSASGKLVGYPGAVEENQGTFILTLMFNDLLLDTKRIVLRQP